MPIPIELDRKGESTLQEQIYQSIRDSILRNMFRTGFQLPSSRELATALQVSRNTVMLAYEWLTSEGYIETRKGAGTFVCRVISDTVDDGSNLHVQTEPAPPAGKLQRPDVVFPYETPILISRNLRRPPSTFGTGARILASFQSRSGAG